MAGIADEYSRRLQEYEESVGLNLASHDRAFQKVIHQAATVARANVPVLLCGELGVGKDVIAHYLHRCSPRRERSFITVSCLAVTEELLEGDLFGKGGEPGKLELAEGGTLFLDEIGEMPSHTQMKLMGALRRKNDIRIVASSSQSLDQLVTEKRFRQDLYFKVAAITLMIPPLRERPDDIVPLANGFLSYYNEKHQKKLVLSPAIYENLRAYHWPGNVRELKSYMERLVILGDDAQPLPVVVPMAESGTPDQDEGYTGPLEEQVRLFEARAIRGAIDRCGGNRTRAMKELGISRRTFYRKCAELQIRVER